MPVEATGLTVVLVKTMVGIFCIVEAKDVVRISVTPVVFPD